MLALRTTWAIALLLTPILLPLKGYSQFFLFTGEPPNVELTFLRPSLEAEANTAFFNVLRVVNHSPWTESARLNLTVPDGWRVIGQAQQELQLTPFDTLVIPLRISVHGRAMGDIGYSVIASLTDPNGNTIRNAYSFVKIKRRQDLRVSVPFGVNYIDQRTGLSEFQVRVTNNGNREELIGLGFELDQGIGFGEAKLERYSVSVAVPPYTDTTFHYFVRLRDHYLEGRESYRLTLTATSPTIQFSQSVWFRQLRARYRNYIPANEKLLTVELQAQGLLAQGRPPNYVALIDGKTLLRGNNEIYYHYRNLSSHSVDDLYRYNHMYIGANLRGWNLEVGDSYMNQESSLQGRGVTLGYHGDRFFATSIANRNPRSGIENLGAFGGFRPSPDTRIEAGFTYNNDPLREVESVIATLGTNLRLGSHSIYALAAANPLTMSANGQEERLEYSGEIRYSSQVNNLRNWLQLRYATPLYYGHHRGRLLGNFNSTYVLGPTHRLSLFGLINNNRTPVFQNQQILFFSTNQNLNTRALHSWDITPDVNFYYGPGLERYSKNHIEGQTLYENPFTTLVYSLQAGSRFRLDDPYTSIAPRLTVGNVRVADFPLIFGPNPALYDEERSYLIYYLDLNFRSRSWSVLSSYEAGPRNIFTQFNYFYTSRSTRTLRIMPSYSSFVYRNILHLDASVSYSNDMVMRHSFVNTSLLLTWFLPHDWRVRVNAHYSVTNRTTVAGVETYQSLYLEAGVRKEFNLPHPRVSYHNLQLVMFKDFNGNHVQEPTEPGIRNVLVTLTRERPLSPDIIPGDVGSIELMSDHLGQVTFERIPNGMYTIQYMPVGTEAGTFTKAFEELTIHLTENTVKAVPFVEKNKVFGRIIMNRSRLSGLGRIDVSNVRVTATDSHGRSFSTLTDRDGAFVLFAPVTDEYVVSINNIFFENFDLRQNNFRVRFNAYKQFEVNFVFDEKVRRINFADMPDGDRLPGVIPIRRTTISGTVKDATSLRPLRARVNLINARTNAIVTSAFSSATSGEYSLTFMAGENFALEVLADDYWYTSETLVLNQITTFMSITRDVMLRPITVGANVELNLRFNANEAVLTPEAVAELNRLLRLLRQNPTVRLQVQGHCDDLEALQRPEVALERANAVARFLIENGYSNLEVIGLGNTRPVAPNDTPEGRALNRRIDVQVISK